MSDKKPLRYARYVCIPIEMWEDEKLTLYEKILFAEIDSLYWNGGSCFASNRHFAKFLGVSERRIQDILKSLEDKGYIEREIVYKEGTKQIEARFLAPLYGWGKKSLPHEESCATPHEESCATPHEESCADNIPVSNMSIINKEIYKESRDSEVVNSIVSLYKEICKGMIMPRFISPKREKAILARFKDSFDKDLECVRLYFTKASTSKFLTGKVKDFRADLDFLMRKEVVLRIFEGQYGCCDSQSDVQNQNTNNAKQALREMMNDGFFG